MIIMVVYNLRHCDENGNTYITFANDILDEIRSLDDENKYKKELLSLESDYNNLRSNPEIRGNFALWDEAECNSSEKLLKIMREYGREKIISGIDKIYIVDALMGVGKTSYMLKLLNNKMFYDNVPEDIANLADGGYITAKVAKKIQISSTPKRFICVVPTLDEIKRYKKELEFVETLEPKDNYNNRKKNEKYFSKLDDFKDKVKTNKNIITTHALFQKLDNEAMELLRTSNYILIIDEELSVVDTFKGATSKDLDILFDTKLVSVDEDGFLIWNEDDDDRPCKFNDIKRLCKLNSLMLYNKNRETKKLLIWNFPYPIFSFFKQTFIMTYKWAGSIQKAYFDLHSIKYDHLTLDGELCPYDPQSEMMRRKHLKSLINIYEGELNVIGEPYQNSRGRSTQPLTKSWYDRMYKAYKEDQALEQEDGIKRNGGLIRLKNHINNYVRNIMHAKANDVMWTCYEYTWSDIENDEGIKKKVEAFKSVLASKGFSLPSCFAPVNCKGTNEYGDRHTLVYATNFHIQPQIANFFKYNGIDIDTDLYSLVALLQWIWRSAIRNGEPINIYIPSLRMRTLLKKWLDGEI